MKNIEEIVTDLAESLAGQQGLRLFDVEIGGNMRKPQVRVYIDKDGGVTLDECEKFSRALSALFDVEDPIPTAFVLEVSSPGLDRSLKKLKHFEQSRGRLARVVLSRQIDGLNVITGRIEEVQGTTIRLRTVNDEVVLIPFDIISRARLEIEL